MSELRPDWDFEFSNGPTTGARSGNSPGCTNDNGDGGFGDGTTGCSKQCAGCNGDWCCDCTGCRPGKCDEEPGNTWCQDYYETWGRVAAGCPPPKDDPCYQIDPLTSRWVPRTDLCYCPGATREAGKTCNSDTGGWDTTPPTVAFPPSDRPDDEQDDPDDRGPKTRPDDTVVVCYLKSVEVFGDYNWHQVPCHCRNLGTPEAIRRCLAGNKNTDGKMGCECTVYEKEDQITVSCKETRDGEPTGAECDPVECNCDLDCEAGKSCNNFGECV